MAREFLRRWEEANERGKNRLCQVAPVAAVQAGALRDPDPWMRRRYLSFLDHHANDESGAVFLAALADPVTPVREMAVHGLSCERCRSEELCVADVVPVVVRLIDSDPSPEVRHKTLAILVRLASRSVEAMEAIRRAAVEDDDALVREAAARVLTGRHLPSRERLRWHARSRKGKAKRRVLADPKD